jgi:homogentisate 1,2-dioxygenase
VCFRSRYDAVQHTFRPPWYHRNVATEFNAIIEINNPYSGFDKGVHWLTPCMSGHGIAGASYNGFSNSPVADEAMRVSEDSIWIMFESVYPMVLTEHGANAPHRDLEYRKFFSVSVG